MDENNNYQNAEAPQWGNTRLFCKHCNQVFESYRQAVEHIQTFGLTGNFTNRKTSKSTE